MNWNSVLAWLVVVGLLAGIGMYHDATTPDNPFEEDPITVNVTTGPNVSSSQAAAYDAELNETLAYWMEHDDQYGTYTANWTVVDGEADLTIRYVDEIESCGMDVLVLSEFTGCSPMLDADSEVTHETVEILVDRPREGIKRTLKHEFGHVYGLNHSSEPQPLMNGTVERYD